MNLTAVVMLCGGVILMYASVKGKDPRGVIAEALGRKDTHPSLIAPVTSIQGSVAPLTPNDGTKIVSV
jgi:hypothetical protein